MKRKKRYYIPGLISLIGLPILFFFIDPEDPVYYTCVKMFIPRDEKPKNGELFFSRYSVYNDLKKKKLTTVDLDQFANNEYFSSLQSDQLSFVQKELERMQITRDTSSALKVIFGDESTYGQFVWLYNQTMLYRVQRFAVIGNDFFYLQTGRLFNSIYRRCLSMKMI